MGVCTKCHRKTLKSLHWKVEEVTRTFCVKEQGMVLRQSRCLGIVTRNSTCVDTALDKDGVIYYESSSFEFVMGDKSGTTTSYVHVALGFTERTRHWIWLKGVYDVTPSCLVNQPKGYLVNKGQLEDIIEFSSHDHKEETYGNLFQYHLL